MSDATFDGILAVSLMAAVTYATRAGGFLLMRRIRINRFAEAWFKQLPGAVFAALSLPVLVELGLFGWIAAALTLGVIRLTGQFLTALLAGFAIFATLTLAFPSI